MHLCIGCISDRALLTWHYIRLPNRPLSAGIRAQSSCSLLPAERGFWFAGKAAMLKWTFFMVAPGVWNGLPCLFRRSSTDTLYGHFKTYLFVWAGISIANVLVQVSNMCIGRWSDVVESRDWWFTSSYNLRAGWWFTSHNYFAFRES